MIGTIRTFFVLLVVAIATLFMAPTVWVGLRTGLYQGRPIVKTWHRILAWALGLRVHVHGAMATTRPLLLASNHVSWTDIIALGSVADVSFIARADMSSWPVVGWLSRLQRTVFIERDRKRTSGAQAGEIAGRMEKGDAMVLFAEGTTADGNQLLPFKSTLFGAASMMLADGAQETVWIQPVAIAYTRLHGVPMGRRFRPIAAWIGDQDMASHVRGLLAHAALDVELHFGEPAAFTKGMSRKDSARQMEAAVRAMMAGAHADPQA